MVSLCRDNLWEIGGIDAVLFDKDGTIVDSHLYWGEIIKRRAARIIERFGLDSKQLDFLCKVMGLNLASGRLMEEGPIALVPRDEVIAILGSHLFPYNHDITGKILSCLFSEVHENFLAEIQKYTVLLDGVSDFIDVLARSGVKIAIVTTDTVKNTNEMLKATGLVDYFEIVVGKESSTHKKTSGIPATIAMHHMNIDPSRTVCIGDAPMDVLMSEAAGCKACIGVASGQIPAQKLRAYTKYVVESIRDIQVLNG